MPATANYGHSTDVSRRCALQIYILLTYLLTLTLTVTLTDLSPTMNSNLTRIVHVGGP